MVFLEDGQEGLEELDIKQGLQLDNLHVSLDRSIGVVLVKEVVSQRDVVVFMDYTDYLNSRLHYYW